MKYKYHQDYVWYPLTNTKYWVEEYPDEFTNCQTII